MVFLSAVSRFLSIPRRVVVTRATPLLSRGFGRKAKGIPRGKTLTAAQLEKLFLEGEPENATYGRAFLKFAQVQEEMKRGGHTWDRLPQHLEVDIGLVVQLYKRAADEGYANANASLAAMYTFGHGVSIDPVTMSVNIPETAALRA